jgi:hypothetical protein
MGEREWSEKCKFNKLVERGAAFYPAPALFSCSTCAERFVSSILKVWYRRCQTDKTSELLILLSPNKNYVVNLSKLLLVNSK